MQASTLPRREEKFPKLLARDQAVFALMVWAGFSLFIFVLTFVVSLVRDIDVSGWNLAGSPARWFGFAIGIYVGWTMLPLYVTHGGTRKGFMTQVSTFTLAHGVLLGVLFALTFLIEAGYYQLMGWPQALHEIQLYPSPLDFPLVALQWVLIMTLWVAGGVFIGAAWYRGAAAGAASILLGLFFSGVSAVAIGGESGPHLWLYQQVLGEDRPGPAVAAGLHLVSIAALLGLTWLAVRNAPIHNKGE